MGVVGWLFALSAAGKLTWPGATLAVLTQVWHLPTAAAGVVFVTVVTAEAALAATLILRVRPRLSLLLAGGFVAVVTVSPLRQALTGSDLGCGCGLGREGGGTNHWLTVARNAAIVGGCGLFSFLSPPKREVS